MKKRIAKKIVKYLASDVDGPKYQIYQSLNAYNKLGKAYCKEHYSIESVQVCNKAVSFVNGQKVEEPFGPFLHITMVGVMAYSEDAFKDLTIAIDKEILNSIMK